MKKNKPFGELFYCSLKKTLLTMRIAVILMILGILQARANDAYSQKTRLSLNFSETALVKILDKIEDESEFFFLYNEKLLDTERKVSIAEKDQLIGVILDDLFAGTDVKHTIIDRKIILAPAYMTKETNEATIMQQLLVGGTVTDSQTGQVMPGVNIVVKGATVGTITDANGKYALSVFDRNAVLVFSFIGYATLEIPVADQSIVNAALSSRSQALDEVVVIGYGTAKRKDFSGSVSSMKMENTPVSLLPNINAFESLKGNIAGLNIGAVNAAGGDPSILIRGQNSIRGSNFPLIVLDGVIFSGSLTDINPNDIATIDVLKDAVSSAVYGSRSSNGIIAVTTKKGKTAKPTITFNASTALQQWQDKPVPMNGTQWFEYVNAGRRAPEGTTSWMYQQVLDNYNAGKEVKWMDVISQTGVVQNYQVAISGAPGGVNYYLSTSYDDNKGIVIGENFNRISVNGKLSANITSWLQIGADANFTKKDYSGITANISQALNMIPYGSMYRDDLGNLEKWPRQEGFEYINPLWGVNDGLIDNRDVRQNYRLNTYVLLTAPWIKGLTYRFNFQNNLNQQETGSFTHEGYNVAEGSVYNAARYAPSTIQSFLTKASGSQGNYSTYNYVFDNILNYNKTFSKHNVDITIVATRDYSQSKSETMTGSDFLALGNSSLGYWGLQLASTQKLDLNVSEGANIGYLGRLNYSFNDKYLFTGSFRRDGASVFGTNKKWGNFAAAGLAWRISNEEFIKNFEPLNSLKIKLSWGQNGNQGVSPYSTLARVTSGSPSGIRYEFSNTGSQIFYGMVQNNMANSYLGWESTEKWNGGFESAWFKNRLFVDLDAYFSKTTEEIYTPSIPSMNGFTSITSSLGEVRNNGVELVLKTINIQKSEWYWSTYITYWLNRNKLVTLTGQDLNKDGKEDDQIASGMFIGYPLGSIYGYVQDGIIQVDDVEYKAMPGASTIDGYPKYKDINNDGKITAADRQILGYPQENFRLNMSNTVSYKNFELYTMIAGIFGGNDYYLKSNAFAYMSNGLDNNMPYIPYWKSDRPSSKYPAAYFKGDGGKFLGLQSRSFVRIQNITLSYALRQEWLNKVKFNSLKIFITASNPIIISDWVGGDPEIGTGAYDGSLPVASTYSFGINTSF